MRIIINQAALEQFYKARGIIRLSANAPEREIPSAAHLAALALRFGVRFADIASVAPRREIWPVQASDDQTVLLPIM